LEWHTLLLQSFPHQDKKIIVRIGVIDVSGKVCKIAINNDCSAAVATETTLREDVLDKSKRRDTMGDKGGKKDKEKGQKQNAEKQKQLSKNKQDKQPKRKP
jgi:hypothetical protein